MSRRFAGRNLAVFGLASLALLFAQGAAKAQYMPAAGGYGNSGITRTGFSGFGGFGGGAASCGSCAPVTAVADCFSCQKHHCPPHLRWCQERPVCIKIHRGCPKPTCDPCNMPNWGYFQTCWSPWPWPPNWSHCAVQPPASMVYPGMIPAGQERNPEQAPPPAKLSQPGL